MDLNGDDVKDLLTGCFEGGLYFIEGKANGEFATPVAMKDADDEILRVGNYWCYEDKEWKQDPDGLGISGHAVDYDDDGDLDLLLGTNGGNIFVRLNEGTASEPKFSTENIRLQSGEGDEKKDLHTGDGHALPIVFDWNKDGKFDIITGSNNRGILWARNVGTKGKPAFDALKVLVEPGQEGAEEVTVGTRLQVAAGDFDNDGVNDLVVGDYNTAQPKDDRTDEEKATGKENIASLIEAQREQVKLGLQLDALSKEERDALQRQLVEFFAQDAGEQKKQSKKQRDLTNQLEALDKADKEERDKIGEQIEEVGKIVSDLSKKVASQRPKRERHGFVWLFRGTK